ncbi:MAG: SusC/RagA family TonB-linked outer membrane protein, partial [Muribaculaceae bacterium]|nr:SusC/RagA family TonB-linked outer membrane protein [Muribaculaceae bacterium]
MKIKDLSKTRFLRMAVVICCLLGGIGLAAAQSMLVKGTVTSASDGDPLIGVTVMVKNSNVGTATDLDGNYSIEVQKGATLVFSYVGMQQREIKVDTSRLDVALLDDSSTLDDLVVIGYGVQKKKLLTGATSQIDGSEILKMNTNSPLQAMQGQLAGVNISSNSGQPGEGMKVRIRGLGTVGNASPLYLIDGVGGDISTLNPADIESIDVLKDAASAAIYGAQAANGVVLVTTKKGREGKARVTFDGYYGIQNVAHKVQMLNAQQYMTIMDEQQIADNSAPYDWDAMSSIWRTDAEGNRLGVYDTDWTGQMFKNNATTQSYTIGVSGGNATSTYAMSLGYLNQEGIGGGSKVSDYSRYNFRINSDHKLFDGIVTVGEQVSFVYKKNHGIGVGNQYNNSLRSAFNTSPLIAIYNADGTFYDSSNSDYDNTAGNPYGRMMTTNYKDNKDATFSGNVYAQLEPIKNLKIRTVFGVVASSSESRNFTPIYHFSIYDTGDCDHTTVNQYMGRGLGMTWTNTISYDFNIKDHAFNTMLGMESYRNSGTSVSAGQKDLKEGFDTWPYAWVTNGTAATSADGLSAGGSPWDPSRSVSYFGRVGWN